MRITLEPSARYHVEWFKVNGVDILDQTEGYCYIFDIQEDTNIAVAFDYFGGTGIDEAEQTGLRVSNEQGRLVIHEAEAGQVFGIYTTDGKLLFQFTAQSPTLHLDLPKGAAYIVKSGNKSFKVML